MRAGRAVVAAVTAWLAVVALGSTVVWAVISRAGEDLVSGRPEPGASTSVGPEDPATIAPDRPITSRRPSRSPSRSTGPSSGPQSPSGDTSPTPDPPASSAPPPAVVTREDSRAVAGGTVFASCKGPALTGVSAVPNAGYRLEREQGPSSAEVKFESSATDREIKVRVVCSGGYPRFSVEDDGPDEDDDD